MIGGRRISRLLFGLFMAQFALVWLRQWLPLPIVGEARWPEGLLLVLAVASTLAALARELPLQNVALGAVLIAAIAGLARGLELRTPLLFGPLVHAGDLGREPANLPAWAEPALWLVAVLTGRGVGRLVLRGWRTAPDYGFRLLGLGVLLVLLFAAGLEPFATRVNHFWHWPAGEHGPDWYGAPVFDFVGWALTALLMFIFATPALLNKRPAPPAPDYYPLAVWVLAELLFATGAVARQLWATAALAGVSGVSVTFLALRPARRVPET